ncbi:MAG: hypothetical protein C5B51_31215 [Terriglobia bacterium]|nr:MAG: hypothetical protein C5B51_31215 [Terriglobia bacterium]
MTRAAKGALAGRGKRRWQAECLPHQGCQPVDPGWWRRRFRLRIGPSEAFFGSLLAAALFLCGCGRYADFTLPPLSRGDPRASYAWEPRADPVMRRDTAWDAHDALNPSVVESRDMFYSGYDGQTWRTLHAESADGIHWLKRGVVLAPDPKTWEGSYIAANGSALRVQGEVWYWYVGGPREQPQIGLARGWKKEPMPVLGPGPRGAWDERGVADPYVIRVEPYFYLSYLGQDRAARQRLGIARSRDGIRWEKLRANPILELGDTGSFDENGLGEPAVWSARGFYWMLYTGRDAQENRRLGLARSADGAHWQKLPAVFAGHESWNSKVICDPTVEDGARVWFGGGDVARPDENIHGQIGFASLTPVVE